MVWRTLDHSEGAHRFVVSFGAVLSVCLMAGCLIKPREPDCPFDAECERCLEQRGCGYCVHRDGGSTCQAGLSYGPSDGEGCPDSAWRFTSCDEPPAVLRCAQIAGCSECARTEGCGYCPETSDCRELDYSLGCELVSDPESLECRDGDCRVVTDCSECASREDCGFCLEERTCRHREIDSGCYLETDPASFNCDAVWCLQAASCEECAERIGCGWCMNESECRHHERPLGCDLEVDPDWQTCREATCRSATSCGECVDLEEDCRWCYLGEFCSFRDDLCPDEYTITSECPPDNDCTAESHQGCENCLADSQCAYCYADIRLDGEYFSGCLVVDALGETYGGACGDLLETLDECPCWTRNSCESCVERWHCTWCEHDSWSSSCVEYDVNGREPVDRSDCESWHPPDSDCWGA